MKFKGESLPANITKVSYHVDLASVPAKSIDFFKQH